MTDLWLEATYDKNIDRFDQARSAVIHQLASVTSSLLDAESREGLDARMAVVQPTVDAIITSATYSDPVLFARVQDDFFARVEATWNQKQAWHKVAETDQWVESTEKVNTYPGLSEMLTFWTLEANGGDAAVYEAPGYTGGWRWMATGRDEVEGDGDSNSKAEAQGKAAEFLSTHSQIAGQMDMFARKTAFNVRKTALVRQAGTQAEVDAWFNGTVLAEYVEMLTPLKPYMVYGPDYKRGVAEKIGDAMRNLREGYSVEYNESVLGALIGTVMNGETWNYDSMENVYRKTSKKTAAGDYYDKQSDPASKHEFVGSSERCRVCDFTRNHVIHKTDKTANVDQITEGQWVCPGCDKSMSDNEKVTNIHVRYECPFRGQAPDAEVAPPTFYDADLDRLLTEAALTLADGKEFSENITRGFYLTALRAQGMVHWAVTDENGEEVEEVDSGSEQSIRDALEQARDTIDQVLQDNGGGNPQPGADADPAAAAPAAPEADPGAEVAPEAPDAPAAPEDGAAPEEAPVAEGQTPPVDQEPEGDPDATNPAADSDPIATPAKDASEEDVPVDGEPGDADSDAAPLPNEAVVEEGEGTGVDADDTAGVDDGDAIPDELSGATEGDADAESIVDSADETSDGEVTGIDPKSMNVGDRINMTYTLTDGTTGDVDVTFVREDNDIFFFDGPNGEFGIGERDEDAGTVWVDSEGQHFAFSDGDALEEVTGEEVPDEAVVGDVDLEAPVGGDTPAEAPPAEAAPTEEAPSEDASAEDSPPADDAAPADDTADDDKKDDDEEDDFKKKFSSILASMKQENPGVSYQVLRSLARRAAKLSNEMGSLS